MWTLSPTYYDRLIGQASASFSSQVQTEERIKNNLKVENQELPDV